MEQRQADTHLDQFGIAALGSSGTLHIGCGRAATGQKCVGERQRQLQPFGQRRFGMTIGDLLDLDFIETLLLRDREADVPSIPAIGDSGVA